MPAFDQLILTTERLKLRPLAESDANRLFAIFSDPRVMRYWSSAPWSSIDAAHEMIARDTAALAAGQHLRLGMETVADGCLIGHCSLFNFNAQCQRCDIGYGMAFDAWGHGYMHEALTALLSYGFAELALNRVEADIDPRNVASAKTLERLGFQHEGFLRERWVVDGEVSDSGIYGLLRRDWLARTASKGRTDLSHLSS
jgi:[ribosomal protein S5]-alanine N-acetyltransferase